MTKECVGAVGWYDSRNRKGLLSNFARNLKFSDTFTSEVAPWIRGVACVLFQRQGRWILQV